MSSANEYHKPWPECPDCGLSAPGVHTLDVCRRMKEGRSLGGPKWSVKKLDVDELPEPPRPDFKGLKPPPREDETELATRTPEEWLLTPVVRA